MKKEIINLLISKGITVTEEEEKQIVEQWESIKQMRRNLSKAELGPMNLGLVNRHGGVYNE